MALTSIFLWGSLAALTFYILLKYLRKNRDFWSSKGIRTLNQPKGLFESVNEIEKEARLYRQTTTFGGIIEFAQPILYVRDLDILKDVFVKDFDYFVNSRSFKDMDHDVWNEMLVNKVDGEWKNLRNTMTPTFTTGKIRNMFPIMYESSKKLVSYLNGLERKFEQGIDFEEILGLYSVDVIISIAAGLESQVFTQTDSIMAKMAKKMQIKLTPIVMLKFGLSTMSPMLAKLINFKFLNTEGKEFFKKVILDTMKHREKTGERRNDFLQLMIDAKNGQLKVEKEEIVDDKDSQFSDRKKAKITEKTLVANCLLFFVGGFDTVQALLTFASYSLALNPHVQEALRRELQDATESTAGQLTYDIINGCEYMDQFVSETLRMYPPGVRIERCCNKDYTLPDGSVLPKGCNIGIPLYQIHYDEKYFPEPSVFDPLRFSKEAKAQRHPFAFMPFGHGPRHCIAQRFALMETKAIMAELVMNFDIEPCAKTAIPMVYKNSPMVRPGNGVWLKIKKRTNN